VTWAHQGNFFDCGTRCHLTSFRCFRDKATLVPGRTSGETEGARSTQHRSIALDIDPMDAALFMKVADSGSPVTLQGRYAVDTRRIGSLGL